MRGASSPPTKNLGNFVGRILKRLIAHTLSSLPVMAISSIITIAVVVQLLFFQRSFEKKAWEKCRRDLEAKGEHLDWQYFVPPAVPDDQNFAMTPSLAPLMDFTTNTEGKRVQRDTNAVARLEQLFAWAGYLEGCDWQRMQFADLTGWQKWFRGLTNESDEELAS